MSDFINVVIAYAFIYFMFTLIYLLKLHSEAEFRNKLLMIFELLNPHKNVD